MARTAIVRFRRDLRLGDHPALVEVCRDADAILPVVILDPGMRLPPPRAWWFRRSLTVLDEALRVRGSRLVLRRGDPAREIVDLARETGATRYLQHRATDPVEVEADERLRLELGKAGIAVTVVPDGFLFDPATIRTGNGRPYRVFTPFWKACLAASEPQAPSAVPRRIPAPRRWPAGLAVADLASPTVPDSFTRAWTPGEDGARRRLRTFLRSRLGKYEEERDRPAVHGTSRLSPHLHFGEISPRQVWYAVGRARLRSRRKGLRSGADAFLRQLGWREFALHLLHHFPHTRREPLRPEFRGFPWRRSPDELAAWQEGRTGYPMVDAAMRELRATGWMHNRARMIVASFLVKDLLLPWQEGAAWFRRTLVDAEPANNVLGWQWTAGCGADAAPWFRIFNPVVQGERFDSGGSYVRQWVTELAGLPDRWVHRPWEAPPEVLEAAGIQPGAYPPPIVDHREATRRALFALDRMRKRARRR